MADYQGQGEALVGWLDCFWDAKGNTTPESFRRYCNTVVPLARFKKFVWETSDMFETGLDGEIVLKTRVGRGGNLMISEIGFMAE